MTESDIGPRWQTKTLRCPRCDAVVREYAIGFCMLPGPGGPFPCPQCGYRPATLPDWVSMLGLVLVCVGILAAGVTLGLLFARWD